MNRAFLYTAALSAVLTAPALSTAQANELEEPLRALAKEQVAAWAQDPVLIEAIKAQNAENASLTPDVIDALDKKWRAETSASDQPTITMVLGNDASHFLVEKRDESDGLFTEIFVMDSKGLNVAASDVTSDFWQGDEAKWQDTFQVGPDAVHVSELELDESTQTYQSQLSITITDPETGDAIGAMTLGVNVEYLE